MRLLFGREGELAGGLLFQSRDLHSRSWRRLFISIHRLRRVGLARVLDDGVVVGPAQVDLAGAAAPNLRAPAKSVEEVGNSAGNHGHLDISIARAAPLGEDPPRDRLEVVVEAVALVEEGGGGERSIKRATAQR